MTKDDKALLEQKFQNIHDKLDVILNEVKRTNGRVTKVEGEITALKISDVKHVNDCPLAPKIADIEKDLEEYRVFKKYPKIILGGLAVSLLIYVATLLINMYKLGIFQIK